MVEMVVFSKKKRKKTKLHEPTTHVPHYRTNKHRLPGACVSPNASMGSWDNLGSRSLLQCNCPTMICNTATRSSLVRHGHSMATPPPPVLCVELFCRCCSTFFFFSSSDMCLENKPAAFNRCISKQLRMCSSESRIKYSELVRLL